MAESHTTESVAPVQAVQWAPDGPMSGVPSAVTRFLASSDGTTYGYGYGPGWSTIFGSAQGDIPVESGQWVVRHPDGRISVEDADPRPNIRPAEEGNRD